MKLDAAADRLMVFHQERNRNGPAIINDSSCYGIQKNPVKSEPGGLQRGLIPKRRHMRFYFSPLRRRKGQ